MRKQLYGSREEWQREQGLVNHSHSSAGKFGNPHTTASGKEEGTGVGQRDQLGHREGQKLQGTCLRSRKESGKRGRGVPRGQIRLS